VAIYIYYPTRLYGILFIYINIGTTLLFMNYFTMFLIVMALLIEYLSVGYRSVSQLSTGSDRCSPRSSLSRQCEVSAESCVAVPITLRVIRRHRGSGPQTLTLSSCWTCNQSQHSSHSLRIPHNSLSVIAMVESLILIYSMLYID
jgi:hypothetical protein